ncbi:MAG: HAD family hydrolase [Myxococcota bacterium]
MPTWAHVDAVLFDLDGVITHTAHLHAQAWKALFDGFLARRAAERKEAFRPFDPLSDYQRFVDGKPRYQGVDSFLRSRRIVLPFGTPQDAPGERTVCGLGNRKDELFHRLLARSPVEVFVSSLAQVRSLRARGVKTALVSSSKNALPIARAAGVAELFDVVVDGVLAAKKGLSGKPSPDTFLEAARQLGVRPERAAVVEDALAGVEAGRRGGFGQVVGVARAVSAEALLQAGADVVVRDLAELSP